MALPAFTHIHCSSRFDRPAASLEIALDGWMNQASIITLTEVQDERRENTLREKGWNHYSAKRGAGADNCAVAWDRSVWTSSWQGVRKLHTKKYDRFKVDKKAAFVHACTVVLKHKSSGKKLLVTVAHMPSFVDAIGKPGFRTSGEGWRSRKVAYIESTKTWSTWTEALIRRHNLDGVLVVADWNLNLKDDWVRDYLRNHWGKTYKQAWKHFPTGGTMVGSRQVLDGSLVRHLAIEDGGAKLMARTASSDHIPYKERLRFAKGELTPDDDQDGDTTPGKPWWGFGDYSDDTLYAIDRVKTGASGGELL